MSILQKMFILTKYLIRIILFQRMRQSIKESNNSIELNLKNEIIAIVLLFASIFLIFSLIGYNPNDTSFFENSFKDSVVRNYSGKIGAEVSAILFTLFGNSSYIIIFYLIFLSAFFFFNRKIKNIITKTFGYLLFLISFSSFLAHVKPLVKINGVEIKTGGIVGFFINDFLKSQIGDFLSVLLSCVLIIISLTLIAKFSLSKVIKFSLKFFEFLFNLVKKFIKVRLNIYKKNRKLKKVQQKYRKEAHSPGIEDETYRFKKERKKIIRKPTGIPEERSLFSDVQGEFVNKIKYKPPPITYLDAPTEKSQIDFNELEDKKRELSQRLSEFKIKGEIIEYTPGPVITTYEFSPDIGVKVREVTNLSEDLALAVKAQYVRIERILGKKAIGIEIPNKKREVIHLREILESSEYKQSRSPLTIALGKTKAGEIFVSDLRDMPHLIIAGATGSGKSVAVHSIILSILYKSSPDEVKLVLIDPKKVELAVYSSLPHLLTPVVTDTKFAKNALDWAVFEMEIRYKKLALLQVRNVEQYNVKLELMIQSGDETIDKLDNKEKMPYIVVIIDEFADLMMERSREIEGNIARIAHKARAVGIHLILATQRPSIDVITGTIKNNFPSRIALAVPSKFDSRTIIDVIGAEKLLGDGDMLFLPPKTASLIRLHCAYVSAEEAFRVVNYLSKLYKPKYDTQVIKALPKKDIDIDKDDLDDLFFDAAEIIVTTGQASASFLQRRLSIGYARAGRLIDQLEFKQVVSAPDTKNKREILMTTMELEDLKHEHED